MSSQFQSVFGHANGIQRFFCPGRVNLIGEHIDYQGGLVLPAAISLGITALCRPNSERVIQLHSTDFNETVSFDLNELPNEKQNHWSDFVLGVILLLGRSGIEISGIDILFNSSLPKASGLSSSAALEVLSYYALYVLNTIKEPSRTQMAIDCQQVENDFIGVNCGIMDQFSVANGTADHAMMLDCRSLQFEQVPLHLNDYSLVIINSNKPRTLSESGYNQRRSECEEALKTLRKSKPALDYLVNASPEDLELLEDATLKKRAKHIMTEQLRVIESAKVLKANNLDKFGHLMAESHHSLRYDYEVSCAELDHISDMLNSNKACLGARMTGAGFGGCCIALIRTNDIATIEKELIASYKERFGIEPDFYACVPSDGVHSIA